MWHWHFLLVNNDFWNCYVRNYFLISKLYTGLQVRIRSISNKLHYRLPLFKLSSSATTTMPSSVLKELTMTHFPHRHHYHHQNSFIDNITLPVSKLPTTEMPISHCSFIQRFQTLSVWFALHGWLYRHILHFEIETSSSTLTSSLQSSDFQNILESKLEKSPGDIISASVHEYPKILLTNSTQI